jgi:TatD DNase family protein
MPIFDTHAHYDSGAFNADRHEVLSALAAEGVGLVVNPGCDVESSRVAVALAEQHPHVYAAVGIHPGDCAGVGEADFAAIRALAEHEKVVAIGEIGLDYYWDKEHKELQKEMFERQINLALSLDLPVIVHDREAHEDCMNMILCYPQLRGVFHCYSGSAEMAVELVKRGWYLGFDGPVTYKNNKKAPEVLAVVPNDRILIETDSPYMTPVPFRGKRNDSSLVRYVCDRIAEIKGMDPSEMERITMENGNRLFGL